MPAAVASSSPTRVAAPRPVVSFVEMRDRGVVRQRTDYSCGAAALATLLTYQWHDPVSEDAVLDTLSLILTDAELDSRRASGFTLLDLGRVARARGYRADGFRLNAEQLAALAAPVIVFIDPDGYEHFAVLKGIVGNRALLADPSRGNVSYPLPRFLDMWVRESGTGIALAVAPRFADIETLATGVLRSTTSRIMEPALADVRSRLPFAAQDLPARRQRR